MEAQVEETVMTHCASSGVLLVWIMAVPHTTKPVPYQPYPIMSCLVKANKEAQYHNIPLYITIPQSDIDSIHSTTMGVKIMSWSVLLSSRHKPG